MTWQSLDLFVAAVAGTYVDVVGNRGGEHARLHSCWLKLHGTPPECPAGASGPQTIAAQFNSDQIPIGEGDRIEAAEVGADRVLRVRWRNGTAVQLLTEQVRQALNNATDVRAHSGTRKPSPREMSRQ